MSTVQQSAQHSAQAQPGASDLAQALLASAVWQPEGDLFHLGTLNPQDKGQRGDSLEGHGLSVSECPESWRAIARLGNADLWRLRPLGSSQGFLDVLSALDQPSLVDAITQWAVTEGLLESVEVWRVSWEDDEAGGVVFMEFEDCSAARREAGLHDQPPDVLVNEDEGRSLAAIPGWRLTPKASSLLRMKNPSTIHALEMATVLATQMLTPLDGVYWDEELDEARLSAPRAVIFPDKLASRFAAEFDSHPRLSRRERG